MTHTPRSPNETPARGAPWPGLRRHAFAVLLPLVGALPTLDAQQAPPVTLTLADAVRLASTTAPAAQAAAGRRAETVGRARAEAQWANPTLELRRENQGAPIPYDDFATVTLPFDLTGRRFALRSALGASRERARADSIHAMRTAEFAAARAWWESWASRTIARIAVEQSALYDRVARIDSLRATEGEISEAQAFRMQIEAQRARHAAGQAIAADAHMRASLAALVGQDDPARIAVADALPALEAVPAVDDALIAAGRDRPDLNAARAMERAADRRAAAEVRGTLPDVGLSGGYKGTGGYSTTTIGVILTAPLLNLNGGNRERSAGELLMASADRRAVELRVGTEVRAAIEAAHALDDGTRGFDTAFVDRATVVAAAAEASYREGAASLVELLDAFRAAADARAAFVRGTLDRAIARLELRRAIGAPAVEVP